MTKTGIQNAAESLTNIQQSIDSKRSSVSALKVQLKELEDSSEKQEIEEKITRIRNEISNLQGSFEHIALGGINLSILSEETEEKIDWREELEQVSRPLLSTLKELTAKPREIDNLRREIERREDQLQLIGKALHSIGNYKDLALQPIAAGALDQLQLDWEQRRNDTQRALEIASLKLTSIGEERTAWYTSVLEAISEFFSGRGLTLFLAIITSLTVWLIAKTLIELYWKWLYRTGHDSGITRAPLVYYSYRLATAFTIVFSILMVFYVRGDVLLLTLALIALVGAALALRQTLPRYTAELRLLLGVGPVREQERLVLDGVPFIVESLSIFVALRNPALEGIVRLPLHTMNALASRPDIKEQWFPCQQGDYIVLGNGSFGKVLRQTIETVTIAVLDSIVQIQSRDLIDQNIRNLSREGFGIACTFGIDYKHQCICLDTVPDRLREGIISRFEQAGLKDDIEHIMVEFSAAGTSSLDYKIYIILDGQAADAYFRSQRLVQQACVEICNLEGWIIPFTQITIHSAREPEDSHQYSDQPTSDTVQDTLESLPGHR